MISSSLSSHQANAQPQSITEQQFEQLNKQCLAANTPAQCREALPACQRVAAALEQRPALPGHDATQDNVVIQMAGCEEKLGQHRDAERHYRQVLVIMQRMHGGDHVKIATGFTNLARVLKSQAKFEEAETLHRQALTMRQKLLGPVHLDIAKSLNSLANLLDIQGKYREAEKLHRQALAMSQQLLGPEHPNVAISLSNLARVLDSQGRFTEAERLHQRALGIRQKLFGAEHPDVAVSLVYLATEVSRQGKYGQAETLYRQALSMQQKLLGAEHPDVAVSLANLALMLYRQGKFGEAEILYRQALGMWQKLLKAAHPSVARNLSNLASVLASQGKLGEAEALQRQALEMLHKLFGFEHPYVAEILNNLGALMAEQGRYGEAEILHRQALEMYQKLDVEHRLIAVSLHNLAEALQRQGKYNEADPLHRQSLGMLQTLLGSEHPDVAESHHALANLLLRQGKHDQAIAELRQTARICEGQLRATASETRMQALLASLRDEEDTIYGLLLSAAAGPTLPQLALTTALLRKGRAAEAGANANRLLHRNLTDPALRQLFSEWQDVRQQRESLLYGGLGTLQPTTYRAEFSQLQFHAESLEAQLSAALPDIKRLHPPDFDAILPAVAKRLPRHGVLVEVVWAKPYQAQATGAQALWGTPHYIAMLLFPDQRVRSIDLGEAAEVDLRMHTFLAALESPNSDPTAAAQALYQALLVPIIPHLDRVSELFLSLDGTLSLVPFDALHDAHDYLLGRYRFHYLTSGRDLLREGSKQTPNPALLLANPDFGQTASHPAPAQRPSLYQRLADLSRLPGTQREAEMLAPLLGVTPLLEGRAREEAVRAARSPVVLHIATHGLFMSDVDLPPQLGLDSDLRSSSMTRAVRTKNISAPEAELLPGEAGAMNRSALVLAGVAQGDRAPSPAQDGLLTAEEARSLDLEGTQLVVLSACETGQGALSTGQGVYGLRRAFLVAGAETLVISLWRVHDEATGELMGMYYRKLLDSQKPGDRLGSMQEAMQELRTRPGRSHPYYWAPFLVIGQDGPLRRPLALPNPQTK